MASIVTLILIPLLSFSQMVGVGTTSPTEKLEVQGKVYSNQGGFKFPDGTVQTTASMSMDPESAAGLKSFGVMTLTNFTGEFNDLGYNGGYKVIDVQYTGGSVYTLGGSGGGPGNYLGNKVSVIIEVGASFPQFYQTATQGNPPIQEILIDLFDANLNKYFTIGMETGFITNINFNVTHVGNGEYAHLATIEITVKKLSMSNSNGSVCSCWNFEMNLSCGCIN